MSCRARVAHRFRSARHAPHRPGADRAPYARPRCLSPHRFRSPHRRTFGSQVLRVSARHAAAVRASGGAGPRVGIRHDPTGGRRPAAACARGAIGRRGSGACVVVCLAILQVAACDPACDDLRVRHPGNEHAGDGALEHQRHRRRDTVGNAAALTARRVAGKTGPGRRCWRNVWRCMLVAAAGGAARRVGGPLDDAACGAASRSCAASGGHRRGPPHRNDRWIGGAAHRDVTDDVRRVDARILQRRARVAHGYVLDRGGGAYPQSISRTADLRAGDGAGVGRSGCMAQASVSISAGWRGRRLDSPPPRRRIPLSALVGRLELRQPVDGGRAAGRFRAVVRRGTRCTTELAVVAPGRGAGTRRGCTVRRLDQLGARVVQPGRQGLEQLTGRRPVSRLRVRLAAPAVHGHAGGARRAVAAAPRVVLESACTKRGLRAVEFTPRVRRMVSCRNG